jgi:hypothetical protein
LEVALWIVGGALFPASEEDADPFEGHCAHRGMMTFAASALGLVTRLGPRAVTDGALTELMEALAQELRAGMPAVDAGLFSTGDAHRANAAQIQQVAGRCKPVTVGAEGRQQSWSQCRAGTGQIVKEEAIGMRVEEFSDPPFVLSDERQESLELLGQQFNSEGVRSDDGEVSGQGLGLLDECQALEDFLFLAAIMAVEELTQLGWRDFLELC